jgi:hypothetical protein
VSEEIDDAKVEALVAVLKAAPSQTEASVIKQAKQEE